MHLHQMHRTAHVIWTCLQNHQSCLYCCSAFMLDLGVAPLPQHLEPLKPAAVYFRMCSNLLNTQLSTSEDRVTSLVRLMAALQPRNHNALELQLKVCADRGFLEEAEGLLGKLANLHAPSSQQIQMVRRVTVLHGDCTSFGICSMSSHTVTISH